MPCKFGEWDSAFFGRRIAEVNGSRLDEAQLRAVERWCDEHAIECLYFLADDDPPTVMLVERNGFGLKDVRLTFARPLADMPPPAATNGRVVRALRPDDDLPALQALAARSHYDSRFYADERFGRVAADELFRAWIRNSAAGWADDVLVLSEGESGAPLGYVTGHRRGEVGSIGLIAVTEAARGGAGSLLVSALCERYRQDGLVTMKVVTQARNVGAQRLYQRLGFVTASVGLWYHRWWSR